MKKRAKKWLDKQVPPLAGQSFLITGATSGIGLEAARDLLYKGGEVTIACRNPEKAEVFKKEVLEEIPNAHLCFVYYDQGVPSSIHQLGLALQKTPFDSIILNAGIYFPRKGENAPDGTSLTFQTNAVGTYLVFQELRKYHPGARYVFVNSIVNHAPKNNDYGLYLGKHDFGRGHQYAVSKRAVMNLFAYASSLDDCDARMCHPGVSKTNILHSYAPWIRRAGNAFLYLFSHRAWKACLGIVLAAAGTTPEGSYLTPRGLFHISGYPTESRLPLRKCRQNYLELIRLLAKKYGI